MNRQLRIRRFSRLTCSLFTCAFALLPLPTAEADEHPSIPQKVRDELSFMVGRWETEMTVNGEKTGTATHERYWDAGKNYLRITWRATENGKPIHANGLSGWNADTREVVEHWYDSAGRYGSVRWPLDKMTEEAWEGITFRALPDGKVIRGKCRLEKGDGRWVFTIDARHEGELVKVRNTTVRVAASAKKARQWTFLTGKWSYEDSTGFRADVQWVPAADGSALVGHWVTADGDKAAELVGWRSPTSIVVNAHGPSGLFWHVHYTQVDKDRCKGPAIFKFADGRTIRGEFEIRKVDADTATGLTTGKDQDGKDVRITGTWKRKAEGDAKVDDFEKLKGFVGTWEAKDLDFDGRKVRVPVSWQPVLDGRFLEHRYMVFDETDKPIHGGIVMFGRDPADGQVYGWGFNDKGTFMKMKLLGWEGGKSRWASTFTEADGTTKKSRENTFELLDKNRYGWLLKISGESDGKGVFQRVADREDLWPERQAEAPEDLAEPLKQIEWWVGQYVVRLVDAFTGETFVGQGVGGWVLDGKFFQYDSASVDRQLGINRYRAILGVDPRTGKTTGWEFESTGAVGKYVVTDEGRDVEGTAISPDAGRLEFRGRMTRTDTGLSYEAEGSLPEGKKTKYDASYTRLKEPR